MADKHGIELDGIDKAILGLLQSDSSLTKAKLAEKVGLTAPAVLERIRKLEERGVIERYVAILNPKRVGQTFTSFVSIVLAVHQLQAVQKFTEAVSKLPQVLECHTSQLPRTYRKRSATFSTVTRLPARRYVWIFPQTVRFITV